MPIRLDDLLAKEFPANRGLVGSGLLDRHSLLLIAGPPKSYKSFLATTMLLELASGAPLWNTMRQDKHGQGMPVFAVHHPLRVLYFEQEMGEQSVRERLVKVLPSFPPEQREAIRENFWLHSCDREIILGHDPKGAVLRRVIDQVQPDVIALDPMRDFHYLDENNSNDMARVIAPLKALKSEGVPCVLIHHTIKVSKDDIRKGPNKIRGSGAIFAAVDAAILTCRSKARGEAYCNVWLRHGADLDDFYTQLDPSTLRVRFKRWQRGRPTDGGELEGVWADADGE